MSIATLGIGEMVGLVILNWESLTRGPMGVTNIPPLQAGGVELDSPQAAYWVSLAVLVVLALLQTRLLRSHLGRTWRAIRDDDVAARALMAVSLGRYKAIAFAVGGFSSPASAAASRRIFTRTSITRRSTSTVSISALTMVILGGMGNVVGGIFGAVALTALPEIFRGTAEYRMLIYGFALLLLVRFRPQGVFGTV